MHRQVPHIGFILEPIVGVSKDYDQRGEVYVSGGFPWYLISIRIKSTAVTT